jgi:hypothetical protein
MQERAQALTIAINSGQILRRLENQIVSKARERARKAESDARKRVEKEERDMVVASLPRGFGRVAARHPARSLHLSRRDGRGRIQAPHPRKLRVLIFGRQAPGRTIVTTPDMVARRASTSGAARGTDDAGNFSVRCT